MNQLNPPVSKSVQHGLIGFAVFALSALATSNFSWTNLTVGGIILAIVHYLKEKYLA